MKLWSDEERLAFISYIGQNASVGDIIPGSGGIRKVRWALPGGGKRGGVRVIYYFFDEIEQVFLLTVYTKNQKADLSAAELKLLKKLVSILRSEYGKS